MRFIKLVKISPFIFFINIICSDSLQSEINKNSIIKIFCKESVKLEFKKNNFEYKESIGEDVCNCYLKNISKNLSHKKSISECKLEKFEKN
tara:strand:- start:278 stop:550 length:273 start_codon:yes stop_codon:yes gene_type:complete